MTMDEERTVFANWAIISSPLVLAIDTTDDDVVAKYYPIVGNEQALAINSEWASVTTLSMAHPPKYFVF